MKAALVFCVVAVACQLATSQVTFTIGGIKVLNCYQSTWDAWFNTNRFTGNGCCHAECNRFQCPAGMCNPIVAGTNVVTGRCQPANGGAAVDATGLCVDNSRPCNALGTGGCASGSTLCTGTSCAAII